MDLIWTQKHNSSHGWQWIIILLMNSKVKIMREVVRGPRVLTCLVESPGVTRVKVAWRGVAWRGVAWCGLSSRAYSLGREAQEIRQRAGRIHRQAKQQQTQATASVGNLEQSRRGTETLATQANHEKLRQTLIQASQDINNHRDWWNDLAASSKEPLKGADWWGKGHRRKTDRENTHTQGRGQGCQDGSRQMSN